MKRLIFPLLISAGLYLMATGTALPLTTAQTVVVAGQALAGSDTLSQARVTITLVGAPCYTSTDLMPPVSIVFYANTAGNWTRSIVGTDSISCAGGLLATYSIKIEHEVLQKSGIKQEYNNLRIPACSGCTTQLRTIVSQQ